MYWVQVFLTILVHKRKSAQLLSDCLVIETKRGRKWLSGRMLDLRLRGRGFEPHRRHWVVVLEQDTFILS